MPQHILLLLLNAGQKYCKGEHSAILLTFIKQEHILYSSSLHVPTMIFGLFCVQETIYSVQIAETPI